MARKAQLNSLATQLFKEWNYALSIGEYNISEDIKKIIFKLDLPELHCVECRNKISWFQHRSHNGRCDFCYSKNQKTIDDWAVDEILSNLQNYAIHELETHLIINKTMIELLK